MSQAPFLARADLRSGSAQNRDTTPQEGTTDPRETNAMQATPRKFKVFTQNHLEKIPPLQRLSKDELDAMKAVSSVLPFRVNEYVIEELIDWDNIPNDPIYQLTFPQPGMLLTEDFERMRDLIVSGADKASIKAAAEQIQRTMNPHPAGQLELNVPRIDGEPIPGMQHKYRETVLFFPTQGQTCHAYCTYCFRWAQFVGLEDLKFANKEPELLRRYLEAHTEVKSVLFTGGDPMVMKTKVLRQYVEPLLELEHIQSIRFGTKAVAYWPQRFVTDDDADDLLRMFEEITESGKTAALMGHYSHPRELSTDIAEQAVRRIRSSGAVVRCQAPLIRHVNDDADAWAEMWNRQLKLGAIPYYMFVERDTGAKNYFEVPLAQAYQIFQDAYQQVSGLGRTVRGPSMSSMPGKVLVDGITEVRGEKVFVLKMIQGRDPSWAGKVFFAKYDENASWLNHLRPAFGEEKFFFEESDVLKPDRQKERSLPVIRLAV